MSNPANAVAKWQKGPLRVGCSTVAAGTAPTAVAPELKFPQVLLGTFPDMGIDLDEFDYTIDSAGPLKDETNATVTPQKRPAFTTELKCTPQAMALCMGSLMQDVTYATTKHTQALWTTPVKTNGYFCTMEGGIAGTDAIQQAFGLVARTVRIGIPLADKSGGRLTLSADWYGMGSDDIDTYTSGSPTLDSGSQILATACTFTYGVTSAKMISADLSFSNNAEWSPNLATAPEAITLGELLIEGSVTVVMTTGATTADEYETFMGYVRAGTTVKLTFASSGAFSYIFGAKLKNPVDRQIQGNVIVAKFPFKGFAMSGTTLAFEQTCTEIAWAA